MKFRIKELFFIFAALASLAFGQVAQKYNGATGARTEPAALTIPSGQSDTYASGSTLTVNGALSGTPTGGTLNLSNTTLMLPSATVSLYRAGNYVAFFGDSLTNYGEGYPFYAELLSLGAMRIAAVASNPGYTSTALLGVTSQVTALDPAPQFCVVLAGTNDAIANTAIATFTANMQTIYARLQAIGCTPVVVTLPPLTGARNALARQYNVWLRRYATANRLPLVDAYAALVDPSTGNMATADDAGDGTHYSGAGSYALGRATSAVLTPLLPVIAPPLAEANTGGVNLITNAWMLTDTNADGISDGWSASPSSGFSYSRVLDARGWYWQRVTLSGASGAKQLGSSVINAAADTFAIGDRIQVSARFRAGQSGATANMILQLTCYRSGYIPTLNTPVTISVSQTQQLADGVAVKEFTVPALTDFMLFTFVVGPADGTYEFTRPTIINLTKNSAL